jgi:hypothetical protein
MGKLTILVSIFIIILFGCKKDESANCNKTAGTYTGTLIGNPLNGTLELIVNLDSDGHNALTGTWEASNGLYGVINRLDVDCGSGNFEYVYGLSLKGPYNIICPDNNPGQPGCYASGATLGSFSGKVTESGGNGYWHADSGAASTVGVTGFGTWVVTKN